MGNIFFKIIDKLKYLFTSFSGWMTTLGLFLISYFQPVLYIYWSMICLIACDAVFGIWVSMRKGSYATSYLGKETSWKILFYTVLFIAVTVFEKTFGSEMNIGLLVTFAIAGAFELLSILANASILKPNLPVLRLFSKFLKGEIARKLGISEEDVEDAIKSSIENMESEREVKHKKKRKNDKEGNNK